ncbi:MAG TPA: TRAP transporter TatT component family protein [Lacunisphaera sp.]
MTPRLTIWLPLAGVALAALAGCTSVNRMAVNKLGDALAGGGTVFASDGDPELIRDAAPFSLKLMESLLAENPRHAGLLAAAAGGFTQYAFAFVQQDADELESTDLAAATARRIRARGLYLRGRDYGLRGLEVAHPGFAAALRADPKAAVAACRAENARLLYWTAAAWAAAIAATKDDTQLIADLPAVDALIERALAVDEAWDAGAIHTFLITYEMSRAGAHPEERARRHFERAVALSDGRQAAPCVAFAEAVCIQQQDRTEFERLLRQALAINPDERPEWRLVNLIMQRRARWLLGRIDELFLPAEPASAP